MRRTGDLNQPLTVKWQAEGGDSDPAKADDFVAGQAFDGEITFQPGQDSELVIFEVNGDLSSEQDETLKVTLLPLENPPAGTTLGTDTAEGVIRNDDDAPEPELSIAASSAVKPEGNEGSEPKRVTRGGGT